MEKTKEIVIDYLNKGINEKRNGNFSQAIEFYRNAIEEDPKYPVSYMNLAKVYIGTDKFELAFRNLLTNIHLRLINNEKIITPDYIDFYQIGDEYKKLDINNIAIKELIQGNDDYIKIANDINVTFYAGLCYIGHKPSFLKYHKIKSQMFVCEKDILLGKETSFQNLRQSKYVKLINIIGLKWIIDNINLTEKNSGKIIFKYIDSNFEIQKLDTNIFKKKDFNYSWGQILLMILKLPIFLIPEFFKTIYESFTAKNKNFFRRIFDILIFPVIYVLSPFLLLIGAIILKSGKRKKNEEQPEMNEESNIGSVENEEYEMDDEYNEWRESLGGKSVLEHLEEVVTENETEKGDFSSPIDNFLQQITNKLKNDLACECFYEYKKVDEYKTDMALQLHLPLLLMEMGLKIDDVMGQNNFICTIAVEIDEYDNIVRGKTSVKINDWDVENALEQMLNTAVTSVGAITKDGKKFRTLKFLIK